MQGQVAPLLAQSGSARYENRSSRDVGGTESSHCVSTTEGDYDGVLLPILKRAAKYQFCPNRIWAVAQGLPNGIWDLPKLLSIDDKAFEEMVKHDEEQGSHKQCTFDFCEQSEVNFTSIAQRHKCQPAPAPHCQPLESLFSRAILDKAITEGSMTAWQLNGAATIKKGQKYMAISHVWSDGTGTGSWDGLKVNRCLYHFFRKVAREFECEGIWWDTVCVPNKKELREKALANMHKNYEEAEITFVHDCFLRNLPWTNAETACIAILMSPWFSRGWTALELAKSGGKVKVAFKGDGGP